jgi:Ca-activated chloride channel family protein
MRRTRKRPVLAALLLTVIVCSCSPVSGKLLVVEGNFYHSQGRYDEAIQAYSKALEYPEILPYAEYALGTVYTTLEEMSPALSRYDDASQSIEDLPLEGREELAYRISYNRGVVLFWEGNFEEAAESFKEALKIDGSRIDAKRNLELALLSLSQQQSSQAPLSGEGGEEEAEDSRLSALFQYLSEKEQNQWKSREWEEEKPSAGPDY